MIASLFDTAGGSSFLGQHLESQMPGSSKYDERVFTYSYTRHPPDTHVHTVRAGGSGFLGQHLVSQLLASGKYDVRVFDVRDIGSCSVPVVVGDLRKREQVGDDW